MAWKFLNIGKANAEIDRLNEALVTSNKERDEARTALEDNGKEVAGELEKAQGQLKDSQAALATANNTISALTGEKAELGKQVAKLTEDLRATTEAVQVKVAHKVADVLAAAGAPPAPAAPAAAKAPANNLTGMDRIRAAARVDLQAAGYEKKES
jgi:predicted nuclease with TOPRIM domain